MFQKIRQQLCNHHLSLSENDLRYYANNKGSLPDTVVVRCSKCGLITRISKDGYFYELDKRLNAYLSSVDL